MRRHIPYPLQELNRFGFKVLTGEACAIGLRLLVDLTEEAAEILTEYMGGCAPTRPNYNSGAVKSAFLSRSIFDELMVFALIRENPYAYVVYVDTRGEFTNAFYVYDNEEELREDKQKWNTWKYDWRVWAVYRPPENTPEQPRVGLSNVHAFTGRHQ